MAIGDVTIAADPILQRNRHGFEEANSHGYHVIIHNSSRLKVLTRTPFRDSSASIFATLQPFWVMSWQGFSRIPLRIR
jgi:hypothetical protein